jgi:hypothetical protein
MSWPASGTGLGECLVGFRIVSGGEVNDVGCWRELSRVSPCGNGSLQVTRNGCVRLSLPSLHRLARRMVVAPNRPGRPEAPYATPTRRPLYVCHSRPVSGYQSGYMRCRKRPGSYPELPLSFLRRYAWNCSSDTRSPPWPLGKHEEGGRSRPFVFVVDPLGVCRRGGNPQGTGGQCILAPAHPRRPRPLDTVAKVAGPAPSPKIAGSVELPRKTRLFPHQVAQRIAQRIHGKRGKTGQNGGKRENHGNS